MKCIGGDGVLQTNFEKPLIEAFQRYSVIFLPVSLPVFMITKKIKVNLLRLNKI